MDPQPSARIIEYFAEVTDPRVERGQRHALLDILVIALCAVICGADSWVEIEAYGRAKEAWLKGFLTLPNGIPTHDTFARVLSRLDPDELQGCFVRWMPAVRTMTGGEVIALDGKTVRRSFDRASGKGAITMLSAWATANRLVLGQQKVDAKSNEITALPGLVELLAVEGCVVTIDAMGCQRTIAQRLVEKGADYVLALKGNQGIIHEEVRGFFRWARLRDFADVPHTTSRTIEKDHGRIEERRAWLVEDLGWLLPTAQWPGLRRLGMVEAKRTVGAQTTIEHRYYLTSLTADAARFGQAVRSHWGIENGLHWVLDGVFREDQSRLRRDHAAENFAVLGHLALSLLRQETSCRNGLKVKRLKAAWNNEYLTKVLFG